MPLCLEQASAWSLGAGLGTEKKALLPGGRPPMGCRGVPRRCPLGFAPAGSLSQRPPSVARPVLALREAEHSRPKLSWIMNGLLPEVAGLSQAPEDRRAGVEVGRDPVRDELCGPSSPRHGLWLISLASTQPREGRALAQSLCTAPQARILKSPPVPSSTHRPELEVGRPVPGADCSGHSPCPSGFLFILLFIKQMGIWAPASLLGSTRG